MEVLARHESELLRLDSTPLVNATALDSDCRRAVAIGLACVGGSNARVVRPGGLSGNTTALLECLDDGAQTVGRCFVKIGSPSEIDKEESGFGAVRFLWPSTALPHLACRLTFGIGRNQALVYTQAPGTEDLFGLCRQAPDSVGDFVRLLASVIGPRGVTTRSCKVGELRREFVRDDTVGLYMKALRAERVMEVEELRVDLREFVQHGDLHGANVLVDPNGGPFLIDFGRTGLHDGPLDPVLLELSMMFHPASSTQGLVSPDQCRQWTLGNYADGTVLGPVVQACRKLAADCGHDQRSVAAVGWAQALRHLKFPTTSKEHVLAVAEACAQELLGT
jgi:hypothetical protein